MRRKRIHRHEADRSGRAAPQMRQQLDQVELIEEIVLEPQHELVVVTRIGHRRAPTRQLGGDIVGFVRRCREKTRANAQQLIVGDVAWHGPVVKRIAPDHRPARHAGPLEQPGRAMAVGDVQFGAPAARTLRGGVKRRHYGLTNSFSSIVTLCSTFEKVMVTPCTLDEMRTA